ncbi:MAG: hypothetical protein AAF514_17185, partial [Verrucomicrobiota bacterium]
LDNTSLNYISRNDKGPASLFQDCRRSPEFRLLFADRVRKHLFNGGALTLEKNQIRYRALADRIDRAIVAESARWGDVAESTPWGNNPSKPFYTREDWLLERDVVLNDYMPQLIDLSLERFEDANLYPRVNPPDFGQHGGFVETGSGVVIRDPQPSIFTPTRVYYTTDGTDPRAYGGEVGANAIDGGRTATEVTLTEPVTIKARLRSGELWSALTEASFFIGTPASDASLVVSEIHYHPAGPSEAETAAGFDDQDDFEFLALRNVSDETISLQGVSLTGGVKFAFGNEELAAGEEIYVVREAAAFAFRYPGFGGTVAGEFSDGTGLDNGGETIVLSGPGETVLAQFRYDDEDPWPVSSDGEGVSLILVDDGVADGRYEAGNWSSSQQTGGSPAGGDGGMGGEGFEAWMAAHGFTDPLADPDGDGWNVLLTYAFGIDLLDGRVVIPRVETADGVSLLMIHRRIDAGGLAILWEQSSDLLSWEALSGPEIPVDEDSLPAGVAAFSKAIPAGERRFVRVRVEAP